MGMLFRFINFLTGGSLIAAIRYGVSSNLERALTSETKQGKDFFVSCALDEIDKILAI